MKPSPAWSCSVMFSHGSCVFFSPWDEVLRNVLEREDGAPPSTSCRTWSGSERRVSHVCILLMHSADSRLYWCLGRKLWHVPCKRSQQQLQLRCFIVASVKKTSLLSHKSEHCVRGFLHKHSRLWDCKNLERMFIQGLDINMRRLLSLVRFSAGLQSGLWCNIWTLWAVRADQCSCARCQMDLGYAAAYSVMFQRCSITTAREPGASGKLPTSDFYCNSNTETGIRIILELLSWN